MPVLAPKAVGQRRRRRWRRWLPQDGEPLADAAETRGLVLDETEKGGARPGSRGADRRLLQRRQGAGADGGRHRRSRAGERGPKARRRESSAGDGGEPERSARSRGGGTAAAESFGQNALLQVGSNWPGGGRVVLVRMQPQYAREEI